MKECFAAFLFTSGWENHIEGGQYYLLVPALCMVLYYLFHKKNITAYLIAGIIASSLLLIRPNIIWFFIPFVFVFFVWTARNRIVFALAALLPLLFTIAGPQKIAYWKNFRQALNEQTKAHQSLSPTLRVNAVDPGYVQWEGWDKQEIAAEAAQYPFNIQSEHGNLFVMSRWLFHISLPVWLLIVFPAMFLLLVLPVAYRIKAVCITDSLAALSMLAFCLYMLSDICSPFHRFQYNTAQWLFPLLLSAAYFNRRNIWLYGLILAGMALNIAEIPSVGYEHTAGEYLMFIAFTILGYKWALAARGKINSRA